MLQIGTSKNSCSLVGRTELYVTVGRIRCTTRYWKLNEDDVRKLLDSINKDPNLNEFQKKQLMKVLLMPDPKWNEDEFLATFPKGIRIFLIEHFPYPIPKYLKKVKEFVQ